MEADDLGTLALVGEVAVHRVPDHLPEGLHAVCLGEDRRPQSAGVEPVGGCTYTAAMHPAWVARVDWLERQWTPDDGIFYTIRHGAIDWAEAERFASTVLGWADEIPLDQDLPARFVALLWSAPQYIENFRPSLEAAGESRERIRRWETDVWHAVSSVLGLP